MQLITRNAAVYLVYQSNFPNSFFSPQFFEHFICLLSKCVKLIQIEPLKYKYSTLKNAALF